METPVDPALKGLRRWWTLSLRSMLLLVLVVGGGMGWWARQAQLQRAEVARVERAAGAVVYDYESYGLYNGVSWMAEERTRAAFKERGGLFLISSISPNFFGPPEPPPNPLIAWASRTLGVDYAHNVVAVEYMESDKVRDDDLVRLSIFPKMESLNLGQTSIGDAGVAHLSRFRNLRVLELDQTRMTDRGIDHVRGLDRLEALSIAQKGEGVTDAGLARLSSLKRLRSLEIGGPKITNAGLGTLKNLTSLKYLLVTGAPNVTPEGIAGLRQALPGLEIAQQ